MIPYRQPSPPPEPSGFLFRPIRDEDERKAVDVAWLRSFRLSWDKGPIPKDLYWTGYNEFILRLRRMPHVHFIVCASRATPNDMAGFIAWEEPGHHKHASERHIYTCERPMLLYVYTKGPLRGNGAAKAMLLHAGIQPSEPFCFCFRTTDIYKHVKGYHDKTTNKFIPPDWPGGRYNPLPYAFPPEEQTEGESP